VALIPDNTNTTLYKLNAITHRERRGRTLAMSQIGQPCHRRLWFALHWVGEPETLAARIKRIFNTGTLAEEFMVRDLERIGIIVTERQEELWGFMNHSHGFTDGRCEHVPEAPKTTHLLEMKTHNDKSFKALTRDGVKKSKPVHYAQCQRYMGGLGLKRCLYMAYNKNDSDYWIERIRFDKSFFDDLLRKERDIILSPEAPRRLYERGWHECKWCPFEGHCYEDAAVSQNCRTCQYSDLATEGKWVCERYEGAPAIPIETQEVGCQEYRMMKITWR
jgi:hypothetical protein